MITVSDLAFSYGKKTILNGLSFSAGPGECVAIIGSNGSGKSTTLSLITGALKPERGTISVEGRIGFIPQGTALFEDMTVEDNLRFFAGLFHASVPKSLPFGLSGDLKKRVSKLSGGRKKQVSIAAAAAFVFAIFAAVVMRWRRRTAEETSEGSSSVQI